MEKLAPCKKCGYNLPMVIIYGHTFPNPDTYRVSCPNCNYRTREKKTELEAEEAWNKPIDSPPRVKRKKSDLG